MTVILSCGAFLAGAIAALAVAIAIKSGSHKDKHQEDNEQMEYLCEWNAIRAIEREHFSVE